MRKHDPDQLKRIADCIRLVQECGVRDPRTSDIARVFNAYGVEGPLGQSGHWTRSRVYDAVVQVCLHGVDRIELPGPGAPSGVFAIRKKHRAEFERRIGELAPSGPPVSRPYEKLRPGGRFPANDGRLR